MIDTVLKALCVIDWAAVLVWFCALEGWIYYSDRNRERSERCRSFAWTIMWCIGTISVVVLVGAFLHPLDGRLRDATNIIASCALFLVFLIGITCGEERGKKAEEIEKKSSHMYTDPEFARHIEEWKANLPKEIVLKDKSTGRELVLKHVVDGKGVVYYEAPLD